MEPWLSRAARMRPERAALVTPARNWTFEVLYETARGVAGALREQGIGTGDRVGLALAGEQLIVALHGCLLLGAVAVPIDLRLGEAERAPRLRGAALVLHELPRGGAPVEPGELEPGAPATVMYTSGTTAGPKEVLLSAENWLWNAIDRPPTWASGIGHSQRSSGCDRLRARARPGSRGALAVSDAARPRRRPVDRAAQRRVRDHGRPAGAL
jgi:acyl-CoA synthetase (AMP-forming)/AMP-acid ligase II